MIKAIVAETGEVVTLPTTAEEEAILEQEQLTNEVVAEQEQLTAESLEVEEEDVEVDL